MDRFLRPAALVTLVIGLAACQPEASQAQAGYPPIQSMQTSQPQAQMAPPASGPALMPQQQPAPAFALAGSTGAPQQAPLAAAPNVPMTTPFLVPLLGAAMWQAEVKSVLDEQRANLSAENQARVNGIPFMADPNAGEINAYAGCDKNGQPYIVGTQGILEVIDAIAETVATDDMYATHTYEAYINAVVPHLAHEKNASAALPLGIIPIQYLAQPARESHAHELFDNITAFTFGHEMAHHYLGHTGCAHGSANPWMPPASVINGLIGAVPTFTQPLEYAADNQGLLNTLDSGRARAARGQYRWTDRGAYLLLDFFRRLEGAIGLTAVNPVSYIQSHPRAQDRIGWVQTAANIWRLQHPG